MDEGVDVNRKATARLVPRLASYATLEALMPPSRRRDAALFATDGDPSDGARKAMDAV
jgi:hypothetical protein